MKKSNNNSSKNKNKSEHLNKAEDMRQMKMKKLEENNSKISRQIDRSADSWKTSMEQIRKIAKKSQDSSQILDNVFTENENDRSEMDSDAQKDYQSPMMKEGNYRPVPHYYGPFRPLSQHANQTSVMLNQSYSMRTPDNNYRMFSSFSPYAMENNNMRNINSSMNANQSNTYAYNQPQIPKYYFPDNRLPNPWTGLYNPSNPPMMSPYSHVPNYAPSFQRPYNFYPPQQYSNIIPPNPNYFPHPSVFTPPINSYRQYPPIRDDTNGIESMKKYVNSLLDKLELLNDTVAQLKNQNQSNEHHLVKACSQHFRPRPSFNQEFHENHVYRSPSCCPCVKQTSRNYKSCNCWDVPNVNRRPVSSLSESFSQGSGHSCQCNRLERKYNSNIQQNCHSHYQRSQIPPRPHRESPLPVRQHYKNSNFPTNPNYYNCQPQQNINSNQTYRYSNPPRPPTSSLPLEPINPGVALVIDNSNNNNLTNVLVDSSDKSNDLLSMSELADMTM